MLISIEKEMYTCKYNLLERRKERKKINYNNVILNK